MSAEIICGDALAELRKLEGESVNCCVTSPPYWGLRNYGVDGQLGLEKTPAEYVGKLVEVFREVRRVLRKDGTLWIVIGDTYATGAGQGLRQGGKKFGKQNEIVEKGAFPVTQPNRMRLPGLKPKDLIGIPWRLAFALQADGWWLRSDCIWNKPNALPESVKDRPTKSHEYVFLLSKSRRYWYDADAIRQGFDPESERRSKRGRGKDHKYTGDQRAARAQTFHTDVRHCFNPKGRNRRTVWTLPTKPFKGAHFAVYPVSLIEPCILASAPAGGLVLDPFIGSGTTGCAALKNGRRVLGIELNPDHARLAQERISAAALRPESFPKRLLRSANPRQMEMAL